MSSKASSQPSDPPQTSSNTTSSQRQTLESYKIRTSPSPLPLTAAQESEIRDLYYSRVRSHCPVEIRAFALCATGRTISIPFVCRKQRKQMERCMLQFATRQEEDRAREEWFGRLGERRREKEEEEKWKEGQRVKKREWWKDWVEGENAEKKG